MKAPEPLVIPWRGRQVRIRHDDPLMTIYSPHGSRLRAAIELASDVEGLRLVLATTAEDREAALAEEALYMWIGMNDFGVQR